MDWGAWLIVLAIAVFAAAFVAVPIVQRKGRVVTAVARERSALLARREQVLDTLAELEFDYSVGKVAEAYYLRRRQALLQEGAEILRRLDALQDARRQASAGKEALRLRRKQARQEHGAAASTPDDPVEALLAARRRRRTGKAAGFCPQCGAPVLEGDRFCPRCGASLG